MDEYKQVIVVRNDLRNINGHKLHRGKIAAQVAHSSLGSIINDIKERPFIWIFQIIYFIFKKKWFCKNDPMFGWLNGPFTKVVVGCKDGFELGILANKAKGLGVRNLTIVDSGRTEFSEPTVTCMSVGPDKARRVDEVTENLSLY